MCCFFLYTRGLYQNFKLQGEGFSMIDGSETSRIPDCEFSFIGMHRTHLLRLEIPTVTSYSIFPHYTKLEFRFCFVFFLQLLVSTLSRSFLPQPLSFPNTTRSPVHLSSQFRVPSQRKSFNKNFLSASNNLTSFYRLLNIAFENFRILVPADHIHQNYNS